MKEFLGAKLNRETVSKCDKMHNSENGNRKIMVEVVQFVMPQVGKDIVFLSNSCSCLSSITHKELVVRKRCDIIFIFNEGRNRSSQYFSLDGFDYDSLVK